MNWQAVAQPEPVDAEGACSPVELNLTAQSAPLVRRLVSFAAAWARVESSLATT